MTQERKKEYTLRITQANKTQMITILYEMVLDYTKEARDAISIGDKDLANLKLGYAQSCIDELIRSVNLNIDLGKMLHQIYIFSKKELMICGINYSIHRIWKVEQNFRALHAAYKEIESEDTSAPTMENTQSVFAGLTYGKYSINEDVTASSMNRGIMA